MPGDRSEMPPLRLPSEAELARQALAAPLFADAVRLARGVRPAPAAGTPGTRDAPVTVVPGGADGGAGGAAGGDALAWRIAVATGLAGAGGEPGPAGNGSAATGPAGERPAAGGAARAATAGEVVRRITVAGPGEILGLWRGALETVLGGNGTGPGESRGHGAASPDGSPAGRPDGAAAGGAAAGGADAMADRAAGAPVTGTARARLHGADTVLDQVLSGLYLLTALEGGAAGPPWPSVPLPALAATAVVPAGMTHPTDAVLEEVLAAVVRLDVRFRELDPLGAVEYRPVDPELIAEFDGNGGPAGDRGETAASGGSGEETAPGAPGGPPGPGDVHRYGVVRLTPLGAHGLRARLLAAGVDAPLVGDLAERGAPELLDAAGRLPEVLAREEVRLWLDRREPRAAAGELLAAARGDDRAAPARRLGCQQALALVGPEAEPALREVLEDRHLGGLARVWLAERGAAGVPAPSEDLVFWLTVDTLAAQLGAGDARPGDPAGTAALEALVEGLVGRHSGFLDAAWQVDHPATGEVLEAMSRLHPDRAVAKAARRAAYKARTRGHG
ncbi:hypothetical protein [Streptomyces zingiberis]|uniref:Uncharacterized protein n=1 Tax=Streptomyces zingiberis TaxID=2053010 RepID=A0ABX1C060_9ACTN|nr:hypothetical protein [Streptomyces zingiberis]NJQ02141.1 hypothetical protein [Streptomyces zingiberis]